MSRNGKKWKSFIISVTIVILCCFIVTFFPYSKGVLYKDMSLFVSTDIEYAKGGAVSLQGIEFGPVNKGDKITMKVKLPSEKKVNPAIMVFGVNHAVTQVYYNDRLLTSYGTDIDERGNLICHHNYFIEIPEEAWGQDVTICMRATENKAFNRIAQLWLYPAGKAYHYYFDIEFGRMIVALSVLIISLTTLLAIPLLMRSGKRRNLSLLFVALFGLVSATWMTLAEGLQQFLEVNNYLITTFEFVTLAAQVIPLGGFILIGEKSEKKRKMLLLLMGVDCIYVAVISFLNYSNIAHFPVTVSTSIGVIMLNGAVFMWNSLRNMDFSIPSKRASLLGVTVLSLTGIFDVVRFSLYRSIGTSVFSQTQKTFPLGVLIFFILLIVSAIISEREQQERERHSRAKLLASQIQPHFLYNTLASIREIIFDDPQYAARTLSDFTVYLRGAVRTMSDVQVVSFCEELKNIKAYAEIEKMRMSDRLKINYNIEASDFVVPPFSIQPLVENAIRHGIFKRGNDGGSVTVHSFFRNDRWIVEVSDTGTGFDVQTVMAKSQIKGCESTGLKNLMSRLREIINASVYIHSVPGTGTVVTIEIPKKDNLEFSRGYKG